MSRTMREEVINDLEQLSVKWHERGMPFLSSILSKVAFAYKMKTEGFYNGVLISMIALEMEARRDGSQGSTGSTTTRSGHQRNDDVLGSDLKSQRRLKIKRSDLRR